MPPPPTLLRFLYAPDSSQAFEATIYVLQYYASCVGHIPAQKLFCAGTWYKYTGLLRELLPCHLLVWCGSVTHRTAINSTTYAKKLVRCFTERC